MGDEKKKKRKILDKVLMGAIIGGAIGSVMGASIAPKKGEETRKEIIQAAKKAKKEGSKIIKTIKKFIFRKNHSTTSHPPLENTEEEPVEKKIPHEHV